MKSLLKVVLVLAILQGCAKRGNIAHRFSTSDDTLVIRTQKQMGDGLFGNGVTPIDFKDTADTFPYSIVYPKHPATNKRFLIWTEIKVNNLNFVDGAAYIKDGEKIFILDENNNRDLTDDSIRNFKEIKWKTNKGLIKCHYMISNGKQMVKDSSWVRIGNSMTGLSYGRSEHLRANFSIGKESYQVIANDFWSAASFAYSAATEIALIGSGNALKDSLPEKDKVKVGEYLKLGTEYYRFDNISNNGEYITLVKEKDFKNQTGTQTGMLAPDFIAITVDGVAIDSKNLHDKPIIIANSCGCGGDTASTQAYQAIKDKFGNKAHVLHLDSKITKSSDGIQIDVEEAPNKDMYDKYRSTYCSRICYVIGADNRVMEKFIITDWKTVLPILLSKN